MYVRSHTYVYSYTYKHSYVFVSMYILMYICMFVCTQPHPISTIHSHLFECVRLFFALTQTQKCMYFI